MDFFFFFFFFFFFGFSKHKSMGNKLNISHSIYKESWVQGKKKKKRKRGKRKSKFGQGLPTI